MTDDEELRLRLAGRLTGSGHLRTAPWQAAVEAVPRHEFLRGGFFEMVDGSVPTAWRPVLPDDPRWLRQPSTAPATRPATGRMHRAAVSSRRRPRRVVVPGPGWPLPRRVAVPGPGPSS